MDEDALLTLIAQAIKDSTDEFERPVEFYVTGEAMRRFEKQNPDGDWHEQPEAKDGLADYKIIARAVMAVLPKSP